MIKYFWSTAAASIIAYEVNYTIDKVCSLYPANSGMGSFCNTTFITNSNRTIGLHNWQITMKQAFVLSNIICKVNLTGGLYIPKMIKILYSHSSPGSVYHHVGDDYYTSISSFEWFPELPIYPFRGILCHWQLIGHALKQKEYLDLMGEEPSRVYGLRLLATMNRKNVLTSSIPMCIVRIHGSLRR